MSNMISRRQGIGVLAGGLLALPDMRRTAARQSSAIGGRIVSMSGEPLAGARVSDGVVVSTADGDGAFTFSPTAADGARRVRFSASGYRDRVIPFEDLHGDVTIELESRDLRALYINPSVTTLIDQYDAVIELINATNANAVVLDIKEEYVWYDTRVDFFRNAGTVDPRYDLDDVLARFKENNIYTIARLVVFKDSIVASVHPELSIRHTETGEPWRDQNGVAWVNPLNTALWTPNIDLAFEAAEAGFDEIQYDYIRFPTDGDLTTMDFGVEVTQELRQSTIEGFLELSRERLLPTGAKQAADVFGFTMVVDHDLTIGQNFPRVAQHLDYLCPMVYPSHYANHQFGLPGHPNEYPYEVIDISLAGGVERLQGNSRQIRPWLQDFTYPGMNPYGPAQVHAQIQACVDHGTSGWMLWDPRQIFNVENLAWEESGSVPNPENVIDGA
jgi:hypothetical protein